MTTAPFSSQKWFSYRIFLKSSLKSIDSTASNMSGSIQRCAIFLNCYCCHFLTFVMSVTMVSLRLRLRVELPQPLTKQKQAGTRGHHWTGIFWRGWDGWIRASDTQCETRRSPACCFSLARLLFVNAALTGGPLGRGKKKEKSHIGHRCGSFPDGCCERCLGT